MLSNTPQILFFLEGLVLASIILMNLTRKSSTLINLYIVQSLIVVSLLFAFSTAEISLLLTIVTAAVLAVKVIIAPYFFNRLIDRHQVKFTASTYMSTPVTLIMIAALTGFSFSDYFKPLISISGDRSTALLLSVAAIFISILLIINRKGVLSQMTGILSLENSILTFALLSNLEQSAGAELGILFDILVWIIIANIFASMVYTKFGSLDASVMSQLKEE